MEPDPFVPTRRSLLSKLKDWGDNKSWQEFYDIYARLIYGAALKAGLTETEAEDVVQETVIAVAQRIADFKYQPEKSAFKTWLHGITKRKVVDQFRKRKNRGRNGEDGVPQSANLAAMEEIPDPSSRALDEAFNNEWEQTLLAAATERVRKRISPTQFQIFDYHVLQNHGVLETSRTLGVSAARVYLAKHRVSAQVRQELEELKNKYV